MHTCLSHMFLFPKHHLALWLVSLLLAACAELRPGGELSFHMLASSGVDASVVDSVFESPSYPAR